MASRLESYSEPGSGFAAFSAWALGTENTLLLAGPDPKVLREAAQEAFETLERLERALSKFLPSSDVSLLNALGAERPVRAGGDLLHLLRLSREAWDATGGAFDPTVGPLMAAWGLVDMSGRVPPDEDIDALLEARGMDRVLVDEEAGTARFDRPGVMVDLGGIGKGYAVDRVARGLRDRGIEAGAVISGRSSIVAWGRPPGEDRWALDVVHPEDPEEALGTILAEPGAISSSGAYARRFVRGGKEYGHVLDPRTGRPARKIRGCTVWTESAVLGDVLSTALFVLGREAFESGGCAARLAEAWVPPDGAARVSALLVEEDPGVWGGLRTGCFHIGEPAFTLAPSGE